MSTVNYNGDQTINQQLSAAGVITLPAFLSPAQAPSIANAFKVEPAVFLAEAARVPSLRSLEDADLRNQLTKKLKANPVWRKLINSKRMSVGIVDMGNSDDVQYATVNGRHMMYAASLPKIAVLAAAHDAIERGEL